MISQKMQEAINQQVKAEFYSAHLYLAMAAYLDSIDLPGFSNWMRIQYKEEVTHAEKFMDHVVERDGRATIYGFEDPPSEWKSPLDVFESAYAHEQKVTSLINNLVKLAREEHDYASENFLQWFVNEQVEEEATAKGIVQQLKMIEGSRGGLFMIDRELGQRVFTAPVE